MKTLKRILPCALIGLASCGSPPTAEPAIEVAVAVPKVEPKADAPQPAPKAETPVVAVQPKKEEPPAPTSFPFPKDQAGKLLPNVVRPPMPALPAAEKFGAAPKPRIVPKRLIEPDALPKLVHSSPTLPSSKPTSAAPTAPPERVPLDLGFGAAAVPARPAFPNAPGIAIKAREVNQLPDLVPLARQVPDRAALDDPTLEQGNAVIATKSPLPVLGIAVFLKVVLPDPFELADHVKPKVPPTAEPSPAPVAVNPQRMK